MDGFEIKEVFTGDATSSCSHSLRGGGDPLDILHVACGGQPGRHQPSGVEDLLYLERTDQGLACDGRKVIRLAACLDHVELVLSEEGAWCCSCRVSSGSASALVPSCFGSR